MKAELVRDAFEEDNKKRGTNRAVWRGISEKIKGLK
jgi:hypothetical protein